MRPAQQLLFGKQQLIDTHSLLLFLACFLSLGRPEDDTAAKQDHKDRDVEQRLPLVALDQPVKVDGSGSRCGINQPVETLPVFAPERADRPLCGGESQGKQAESTPEFPR